MRNAMVVALVLSLPTPVLGQMAPKDSIQNNLDTSAIASKEVAGAKGTLSAGQIVSMFRAVHDEIATGVDCPAGSVNPSTMQVVSGRIVHC